LIFSTTGATPVSGFGKAKARIDKWISESRPMASAWTLHDLRRTMVTVMNENLQVPPHVVEAVVNHVSGDAKRGVAKFWNDFYEACPKIDFSAAQLLLLRGYLATTEV
jgi:hypothetical protein